jgi:glycyl-tRNA synthetase beta chain
MPSFLLELFSEEIPARMQSEAARHLKASFEEAVQEAGLRCESVRSFVTPRRLAVTAAGIPLMQPDSTVEKKGPRTSAPQAALDGFLRKEGLAAGDLEKRMIGKDETYFAVIHQKGQPAAALLKGIIEKILAGFPWPKSMRWGSGATRWVRPLHSIICLLGDKIVPVEFAGIRAGNLAYGHRFLAPRPIIIGHAEEYENRLLAGKVIADTEKRKAEIAKQLEACAAKHNLKLKKDEGLLNEVTGLVEFPNVLAGTIDEKFMDLPWEVLVSEMRTHQKYFALSKPDGTFSNKFLITSNMVTLDPGKAIIAGNERVLRARLADGRFFFDQDRKKTLEQWAEGLKSVTFHARIGTVSDKVERIKALAAALADAVPGAGKNQAVRAAQLCKADLVTGMVGEFPELQGVMGRYYALCQKEPVAVADAIRDHYLPLGPDSPTPDAPVSLCVALADKLDTLVSMFAAGEKPTGSKDPFALRRSALGIIRIILENNLRLPLKTFLNGNDELMNFFHERLIVQLKDKGIRPDVIKSVISDRGEIHDNIHTDDLVQTVARAEAVQHFLHSYNGTNLLIAYKRAVNIVNIEEKNDNVRYTGLNDPDATIAADKHTSNLAKALSDALLNMKNARSAENFSELMNYAANLREPIDDFFTNVLINADDKELRNLRLRMLAWIRDAFHVIADFSLIEG